jgi:threonine/homoserine/homoserine lactone efflux protein
MKIVMRIVIAAMGVYILRDTPMGFVQIFAGAYLTWRGVQQEIKRASRAKERGESQTQEETNGN